MGITLDGTVNCDGASFRSSALGARPPRSEERGPRWADLLSEGEDGEGDDEEECVDTAGNKKASQPQAADEKDRGAAVAKRPQAQVTAAKRPVATATRGNKRSERVLAAAPQSRWKVKDSTGKTPAASYQAKEAWAAEEWSSWDDEWSTWDDDWAQHGSDGAYGGWAHQWSAPRDGGRKLQCQFHIGIEEEPEFRVCRRLLGPAGKNMKAIAEKTGARLRLRGRGSRFREGPKWEESDDPLMLCVSALGRDSYDQAVRLVRELLEGIYRDYAAFPGRPANAPQLHIHLHEGAREGSGAGR